MGRFRGGNVSVCLPITSEYLKRIVIIDFPVLVNRATDKTQKIVITNWKSLKTRLKNIQGVKICISILRYTWPINVE